MSPNNVITAAEIDSSNISQADINRELANIMRESVGDPILSTGGGFYIGEGLEEELGARDNERAQKLRNAMLVAIHTYASHANNEGKREPEAAARAQLERFDFNQAAEIYGGVYVDLRNALQPFQQLDAEVDLTPRLSRLTTTLADLAKNGHFSNALLAQARIAAEASKGAGIDSGQA